MWNFPWQEYQPHLGLRSRARDPFLAWFPPMMQLGTWSWWVARAWLLGRSSMRPRGSNCNWNSHLHSSLLNSNPFQQQIPSTHAVLWSLQAFQDCGETKCFLQSEMKWTKSNWSDVTTPCRTSWNRRLRMGTKVGVWNLWFEAVTKILPASLLWTECCMPPCILTQMPVFVRSKILGNTPKLVILGCACSPDQNPGSAPFLEAQFGVVVCGITGAVGVWRQVCQHLPISRAHYRRETRRMKQNSIQKELRKFSFLVLVARFWSLPEWHVRTRN